MELNKQEQQQEQQEQQEREESSDENQLVMWPDGSVSTTKEHEAEEARKTLERLTGMEWPEPQEYSGGEGGGGEGPAV